MRSRLVLIAHTQRDADYPQTPESIERAKLAQARERQAVIDALGPSFYFTPEGHLRQRCDPVNLGLLIGNCIASACYGPSGEWRERLEPVVGIDPRD